MAEPLAADTSGTLLDRSQRPSGQISTFDADQLAATLALAAKAGPAVDPDPMVGSVVCSKDEARTIVGRGHHAVSGGLHAEPIALAESGTRAHGATLYCNLEPCGYEAPQKRQPACTRAILDAGIERVVVGQIDPHPRVRGSGVKALVTAGVAVDIAPDPVPYWLANPVYNTVHWLGRPFVCVAGLKASREIGGMSTSFEYEIEPGAIRDVPPGARSVLVRTTSPSHVKLPPGWSADVVDGIPVPAWVAALRRAAAASAATWHGRCADGQRQ